MLPQTRYGPLHLVSCESGFGGSAGTLEWMGELVPLDPERTTVQVADSVATVALEAVIAIVEKRCPCPARRARILLQQQHCIVKGFAQRGSAYPYAQPTRSRQPTPSSLGSRARPLPRGRVGEAIAIDTRAARNRIEPNRLFSSARSSSLRRNLAVPARAIPLHSGLAPLPLVHPRA